MTEYDIVLVLVTIVGFVISVASVGIRFTRAVGQVESATNALTQAVAELRQVITELKSENKREHEELRGRLNRAENRIVRLETEVEGLRKE
ncbi:MAG: hypothetical protein IJZ37_06895 [Clostridia bacterium]|nr:hypothetical protein [Clostridia bacterium]MBQ8236390.1 hypothetical protein [Clostridia bacterium]MBQ8399617.1 hypothetical protein [Clostridia bacterium]